MYFINSYIQRGAIALNLATELGERRENAVSLHSANGSAIALGFLTASNE
ncbi:hypothetical protein H6F96_22260 [Microcoleus sp. FACHB-53]|nr:hypothetical protein [Microcoleus sp. FACHB-53]